MSLNAGTVQASAELNKRPFMRGLSDMKRAGQSGAAVVSKGFRDLGKSMMRTGAIMAASVTAPVVAGMNKMTKEAALLEGAMAKFNVVFGDASGEMQAWVKEFRKEVPLATREIVQSAAAMQDLLVPMGIARDEATKMSQEWLTLASRLAAFNDVPVDQALEAIRSGVAGMSRPLRQFGIDARETAVQQEALAMGLIETGSEMDEQVRQQALLSLAYKQSKDAVDGFEEQQGSLLLMQQEVSASLKDLAASFGEILLPSAKRTAQMISDFIKRIIAMDESTKRLVLGVSSLAAAIPLVTVAVGGLATAFGLLTSPITLTIGAIAGLIAIGKNVVDNWDIFAAELEHLWKGVALAFQTGIKEIALSMNLIGLLGDDTFTNISKKTADMRRQFELAGIKAEMSRAGYVSLGETVRGLASDLGGLVQGFSDWMFASEQASEGGFGQQAIQMQDFSTSAKQAAENVSGLSGKLAQGAGQGSIAAIAMRGVSRAGSELASVGSLIGQRLGEAFSQALVFSDNLLESIKNIGKQLASKAIVNFLSMAMSPGGVSGLFSGGLFKGLGKVFGGVFHSGGMVPGSGNKMIMAQGGEMVLTQSQQRALGGMQRSGGISEHAMQRAFEKALRRSVSEVSPSRVFELNQQGRRGY